MSLEAFFVFFLGGGGGCGGRVGGPFILSSSLMTVGRPMFERFDPTVFWLAEVRLKLNVDGRRVEFDGMAVER